MSKPKIFKQINVRLSGVQQENLKELCDLTGRSQSELIRNAIDEYVRKELKELKENK